MKSWLLTILTLTASVATHATCVDSLPAHRARMQADYLESAESPFDQEMRAHFAGFSYFDGDEGYCVEATFERSKGAKPFDMVAFNGNSIPFIKYGVFRFTLGGATRTLTAYQRMDLPPAERRWVLVPFQDRTNGTETYGGGRYLQLDFPIRARMTLDFNRAFNPLCAYDSKFTCPVPPPENRLAISIPAGEKSYAKSPRAPGD